MPWLNPCVPHWGNSHRETKQFSILLLNVALLRWYISAVLLFLPLSVCMRSGTKFKISGEWVSFSQYREAEMPENWIFFGVIQCMKLRFGQRRSITGQRWRGCWRSPTRASVAARSLREQLYLLALPAVNVVSQVMCRRSAGRWCPPEHHQRGHLVKFWDCSGLFQQQKDGTVPRDPGILGWHMGKLISSYSVS